MTLPRAFMSRASICTITCVLCFFLNLTCWALFAGALDQRWPEELLLLEYNIIEFSPYSDYKVVGTEHYSLWMSFFLEPARSHEGTLSHWSRHNRSSRKANINQVIGHQSEWPRGISEGSNSVRHRLTTRSYFMIFWDPYLDCASF